MNFIDIIVIGIIIFYAMVGFWKGFIPQLFQFAGTFCAFYFNTPVSNFIAGIISEEPDGIILMMVQVAAFLFIFAAFFIAGKILSTTFDLLLTSIPNRIAGIVFGILNGYLVVCVLFVLVRSFGSGDDFLKKYVTPDRATDELINKGLDLASESVSAEDNKEIIESLKKESSDLNDGTKAYSRLGYSAYRISAMMDPFVANMKIVFKKKYDDVIEIKENQSK